MQTAKDKRKWLIPVVLGLFMLEVLTLPVVVNLTYAGRGVTPEHILTYRKAELKWDTSTIVVSGGVAELSFFESVYDAVESENGDKVIAPGTDGQTIVRLLNYVNGPIKYTSVLYWIREDERIDVHVGFNVPGSTDTEDYSLPPGVDPDTVIAAKTGEVGRSSMQEFDLDWYWTFEEDGRDVIDTSLGNDEVLKNVKVGLYIVVEDDNIYIPDDPKTGDNTMLSGYLVLMGISFVVLLMLVISRYYEKKCGR